MPGRAGVCFGFRFGGCKTRGFALAVAAGLAGRMVVSSDRDRERVGVDVLLGVDCLHGGRAGNSLVLPDAGLEHAARAARTG